MPFFFTRKSRFLKNKHLIMFLANEYFDRLHADGPFPSCKEELMKKISSHIDQYESDFATYTEKHNDFNLVAKSMVNTDSFDLLATGKYHIPGGKMLNSSGIGPSLAHVHKKAVKDALDSGLISKDEYDEDILALRDVINMRL